MATVEELRILLAEAEDLYEASQRASRVHGYAIDRSMLQANAARVARLREMIREREARLPAPPSATPLA